MTTRAQELSLQAINNRLERSATAAQQRTVAPQSTRFDGVTGGFSGAVPRFRPLGSDGGVLGLPQASGALGVGAPVGFVAGLGSATPRLGDPGLGGAVLSPEAIRASVLAQTGWQVGDGTPTTEGIVARYPFDVYYSRDLGAGYYWNPSTSSTQGSWIAFFQQHGAAGAPAIDSVVSGGTAVNETNGDLYAGDGTGSSGWTLITGGGGGGGCCVSWELDYTAFLEGAEAAERVRALVFDRDPTLSITTVTPSGGELFYVYPDTAWYRVEYTYQPSTPGEPTQDGAAENSGSDMIDGMYNLSVTAAIESDPAAPGFNRIRIVGNYTNTFGTASSFTRFIRSAGFGADIDGDILSVAVTEVVSSTPDHFASTPGEYQITVNGKWLNGDARTPPPYQQTVSAYFLPTGTLTQYE